MCNQKHMMYLKQAMQYTHMLNKRHMLHSHWRVHVTRTVEYQFGGKTQKCTLGVFMAYINSSHCLLYLCTLSSTSIPISMRIRPFTDSPFCLTFLVLPFRNTDCIITDCDSWERFHQPPMLITIIALSLGIVLVYTYYCHLVCIFVILS